MKTRSSKHILIAAHHWHHDSFGGSFKIATEFAQFLTSVDFDVSYICCPPSDRQNQEKPEEVNGVRIFRYPFPTARNAYGRMKQHISNSAALAARINAERPIDYIHGHSPLQFRGTMGGIGKCDIRSIYTVHSPFDMELASQAKSFRSRLFRLPAVFQARRLESQNLRDSKCIHALSNFTARTLKGIHKESIASEIKVIPGWVCTEKFTVCSNKLELRRTLSPEFRTDLPLFLSVRRLQNRMGLETLVEAASICRANGKNFRVIIGGDGPLRQELQNRINEKSLQDFVYLIGRIPEAILPQVFQVADCFVLPTKNLECFGIIVIEAFASGIPVIASKVAAIPELVGLAGSEWLFECDNAQSLAQKMIDFINGSLKLNTDLSSIAADFDSNQLQPLWKKRLVDE